MPLPKPHSDDTTGILHPAIPDVIARSEATWQSPGIMWCFEHGAMDAEALYREISEGLKALGITELQMFAIHFCSGTITWAGH